METGLLNLKSVGCEMGRRENKLGGWVLYRGKISPDDYGSGLPPVTYKSSLPLWRRGSDLQPRLTS